MSDYTADTHTPRTPRPDQRPVRDHTTTTTTTTTKSGAGAGMAFILGIVVVVLAVLAWAMFGGDDAATTTAPADDVNVTIEDGSAPAESAAPVETAPAEQAAPVETAPEAAPEAAPATDGAAEETNGN
ncbi:hypothetical protein CLG85_002520 [Yangia mangrovi]|uniref:Uncharacterized protein n=1 Tax=Alloyangia mangrovi TaxID=1779329 RepID=A0ABT2KFZ7_9RHOB|nr:hypothetical protein [Alloyangia mangrovi]MCA0940735.1 hypothetical protein [Alloyangia pacifica]MCA0946061.1 hypothetical protein [Alloyangia pacifica]MCT4369279.1 hypothetical protein [Alloyangia mangrovi]